MGLELLHGLEAPYPQFLFVLVLPLQVELRRGISHAGFQSINQLGDLDPSLVLGLCTESPNDYLTLIFKGLRALTNP